MISMNARSLSFLPPLMFPWQLEKYLENTHFCLFVLVWFFFGEISGASIWSFRFPWANRPHETNRRDLPEPRQVGRGSYWRALCQGTTLGIRKELLLFIQVYLREAVKEWKPFPMAGKTLLNHNWWDPRKVAEHCYCISEGFMASP